MGHPDFLGNQNLCSPIRPRLRNGPGRLSGSNRFARSLFTPLSDLNRHFIFGDGFLNMRKFDDPARQGRPLPWPLSATSVPTPDPWDALVSRQKVEKAAKSVEPGGRPGHELGDNRRGVGGAGATLVEVPHSVSRGTRRREATAGRIEARDGAVRSWRGSRSDGRAWGWREPG